MQQKKILLVDDSRFFIELEKNILPGGNYQFFDAKDGREALKVAHREKPDLILLDLNMPVMNGIQFLKELRNDPDLKTLPVIVVTTKGKPTDIKESFQAGASDHISKPIDNIALQLKVQTQLDPLKIRLTPRLQAHLDVKISDFEQEYNGMTSNISTGGINFYTNAIFQIGQKLEVTFELKHNNKSRIFRVFGQVVSLSEVSSSETPSSASYEVHLQFLNLSWDDFTFLDHLINTDVESVATFLTTSSQQRSLSEDTGSTLTGDPMTASLANELDRMLSHFSSYESTTKQFDDKHEKLIKHLKELQLDFRNLSLGHSRLREQYINVLILHIVSKQLNLQQNFKGVLDTLADVCENMLGADQFDICIFDKEADDVSCFSLLTGTETGISFSRPLIKDRINAGEVYIKEEITSDRPNNYNDPLAVIPLSAKGSIIGYIVIATLLPHRESFNHTGLQLIDIIRHQVGRILYSCMLESDTYDDEIISFIKNIRTFVSKNI